MSYYLADPKPGHRVEDSAATKRACLKWRWCGCCSEPVGSGHHVLPKSERGDDVLENIVPLCGSGTTGCHGAVERHEERARKLLGRHLQAERPDVIAYLIGRLGHGQARAWLRRHLFLYI